MVPITKEMEEWFKNKTPEEIVDSALPDQILLTFIDPDFDKRYKE